MYKKYLLATPPKMVHNTQGGTPLLQIAYINHTTSHKNWHFSSA